MRLTEIFDSFLNEPKSPEKPKVDIGTLIAKGTSYVLYDGELYKVVVTKNVVTKDA